MLKEETSPTQYPEEILAMDKEIEELKAKLQAAITAKNKAKSSFTKTVPALFGQPGEYEGIYDVQCFPKTRDWKIDIQTI